MPADICDAESAAVTVLIVLSFPFLAAVTLKASDKEAVRGIFAGFTAHDGVSSV